MGEGVSSCGNQNPNAGHGHTHTQISIQLQKQPNGGVQPTTFGFEQHYEMI